MKFLVTSDWHGDAVSTGVRRFAEVRRAAHAIVDAAKEHAVDIFIFAGDLCDPDCGSTAFRILELALEVDHRLAEEVGCERWWMAGNHCVIEDGSGDTVLSPLRATMKGSGKGLMLVAERPMHIERIDVDCVLLPFTASSHAYDPAAFLAESVPTYEKLDGKEAPVLVVGHLSVPGIEPGEETKDMPRGREVTFPLDAIRARPDRSRFTLVNGHYHRQQHFDAGDGLVVHVPGSPARFTFGEEWNQPGFLIIEV